LGSKLYGLKVAVSAALLAVRSSLVKKLFVTPGLCRRITNVRHVCESDKTEADIGFGRRAVKLTEGMPHQEDAEHGQVIGGVALVIQRSVDQVDLQGEVGAVDAVLSVVEAAKYTMRTHGQDKYS
jgi:hypothetical protein